MMGILAERRLLEGECDGGMMGVVKTSIALPPANSTPTPDPFFEAAVLRVREAVKRLKDAGIIDSNGNRIRQDLPPDMREDKDRDFGG
jgi:hypothetical protein